MAHASQPLFRRLSALVLCLAALPSGALAQGFPNRPITLLVPKLPYVPTRDLAPVILSHLVDFVVVVRADAPYATLAQLVAAAKAQPGKIAYGSTGVGGPAHLGMELFGRVSGTNYLHVP